MHLAARKKDHHLVKTMIEAGGQVDSQNNEGQTVLHLASLAGHQHTVAALLDRGCDSNVLDSVS